MAKRLFAWALVLALVFSLMPMVSAETVAPGMSEWHDHTSHEGWTEWTDKTSLPTTAGKYYLSVDVTLTKEWTVPKGDTHLCLGGHSITQTGSTARVLGVNAGRSLSIYDCAKAYEGDTYVGGTLTGGKSSVGSCIWIARGGGVFNLYGGRITGNAHATAADGGAVYLQSGKTVSGTKNDGGVFNMYGGEIVGNGTASKTTGSAVYLHGESGATRGGKGATFNMYGGKIAENTGKQAAICGTQDSVINIQGGEIVDNVNSGSGGAIYAQADMVLTVANATITGNKSTNASAIYVQNNVVITIRDSVITDNVTTGNSDEGWCAAVYVTGSKSKVTLSGEVTIEGNTMGNPKIADLYLNSSSGADIETLYVSELTGGAVKFGVHDTAASVAEASDVVAFADPAKTTYSDGTLTYWTGTENKYVGLVDGAFRFVEGHFHGATFYSRWTDGTKLPSSGTYYLDTDVTLANYDSKAAVKNGNSLTLCLNGHTIDNKKNIAVQETFRVENGSLYLNDCTTTYDANGHFVSGGKVTGGMKKGNGAVIYANNAASVIVVEGIAFVGNESTETATGYGGGVVQLRKNTTPAQFTGCLFSENISAGGGGAIALREGASASFEKCAFTKNKAAQAAAIYITGSTLTVKDSKFTENTTTGAVSVMNILGVSTVTIQDTTITGNTSGGSEYGAVNLGGGNSVVKLMGKTVIEGNLNKNGDQQNLHLQQYDNVQYDVSGLTAGAKVGVTLLASRITAGLLHFTTTGMTENSGYCVSDNANYKVVLDDQGRLALEEIVIIKHDHKLCNDDACLSHGDVVAFQPWESADSLPTSGSYYLETDVNLTAATTISGELNLCLNGHTITQSGTARVFYLNQDAKLNITDCAEGGKILGGKDDTGAAFYLNEGAVFSLYAGTITGSSPASANKASSGAAIFMRSAAKSGATFNMYGGEITGNGNEKSWGGAITNGSGNANNTVCVNIYGGKIHGNTAGTGGAIRLEKKAVLTVTGGEIYDNTATTGGAIYLVGVAELNLQGGKITDNTADVGAGIYVPGTGKLTVSGAPLVTDNTAAGKQNNLYLAGQAKITLGDVASDAKVGITAASVARAISNETEKDYTANFVGDSSKNPVIYKDKTLWVDFYSDHQHTVCDGVKHDGCDHQATMWLAWESKSSLPTASGYYYLTEDVVLTGEQTVGSKQEVYLCLNGKTVTAAENKRHMLAEPGATVNITDCCETVGGFTGGNAEYGSVVNMAAGSTLNLFAGKIYGNASPANGGGAVYLRGTKGTDPGAVMNMYGGVITENTSNADGAAISMNAGTKLNIHGGEITKNTAVGNGGGIFATGNDTLITMNGGEVSGNTARNGGGLITQSNSSFVMNGGTVSGNTVTNGGGAVYVSVGTSFQMNGGKITGNTSNNGGGFYALRSTATLNGGEVSNNKATTSAGAFRSEGATVVLNKVTISGNASKDGGTAYIVRASAGSGENIQYFPSNVTINDGALITGNKGESNSGGLLIANDGVVVTMNGGEISKNTAANGGGIMTWKGSTFVMNGGKITGNSVKSNGGGAYISSKSTFKMNGGSVTGNTAKNAGGIYMLRANVDLVGGTISYNTAKQEITWKDGKEVKNGGDAGGIYICGSKVNLRGTSLMGNTAGKNGGAIVMGFSSSKENSVTVRYNVLVNIYGGTFSGNTAQSAAGGMLIQSEGTVVNMYGGTFTNNTGKNAGAIYVSTKTVFNMSGGTVANNKATASAGAIYVLNSTANITGGQLYGNMAATSGGLLVTSGATTVVRMENLKIHDNKGKTHGAVFVQGKSSFYAVSCDFYNNFAGTGGDGGVCIGTQSKGELTNCKFYGNTSEATSGAMMVSTMAEVKLTNCDFTENYAASMGGAIYTNPASQVTITNTTFRKNSAREGGAILCRGNITMTGCMIEENTSTAEGGAVYGNINAANGSGVMRGLVIEDSEIRNNTAGGKGGAFYMHMGCRLELHNCQVTDNSAAQEGGAIWSAEDVVLDNTKITGNASGGEGYAVYMDDANYDGHSYSSSKNQLSGSVIIKDNMGGDLWMGPDVFFAITADGMGKDTHIELTLDSGKLTNRILGAYHYEGGDCVYTVTYGDRSMTDPEYDAALAYTADKTEEAQKTADIWLYVGIGAVVLALAAVAVLLLKKKKAGKPAETKKEG